MPDKLSPQSEAILDWCTASDIQAELEGTSLSPVVQNAVVATEASDRQDLVRLAIEDRAQELLAENDRQLAAINTERQTLLGILGVQEATEVAFVPTVSLPESVPFPPFTLLCDVMDKKHSARELMVKPLMENPMIYRSLADDPLAIARRNITMVLGPIKDRFNPLTPLSEEENNALDEAFTVHSNAAGTSTKAITMERPDVIADRHSSLLGLNGIGTRNLEVFTRFCVLHTAPIHHVESQPPKE